MHVNDCQTKRALGFYLTHKDILSVCFLTSCAELNKHVINLNGTVQRSLHLSAKTLHTTRNNNLQRPQPIHNTGKNLVDKD